MNDFMKSHLWQMQGYSSVTHGSILSTEQLAQNYNTVDRFIVICQCTRLEGFDITLLCKLKTCYKSEVL